MQKMQPGNRVKKVVINVGIGKILGNVDSSKREEIMKSIERDLAMLSGQKPIRTLAKKAIAGFKIKKGSPVGMMVTLRGKRMDDFLQRLINFALPRQRDFQGIDLKSIDSGGNLTIGIKEHIVFPEIEPEKVKTMFSLEVTVVPDTNDRKKAIELFKKLGFPLKKNA